MANDAWGRGQWEAERGSGVRGDEETLEEWGRRLSGRQKTRLYTTYNLVPTGVGLRP